MSAAIIRGGQRPIIIPSHKSVPGPPGPPGSGSTIAVSDEGLSLGTTFTRINVTGAGATATNAGSGVAQINIPGGGGGSGTEVIDLKQHGFAADGTAQSASAIAALINATPNGAEVLFPFSGTSSHFKLDGPIIPTKPVTFKGYGAARGQSGGTGRTHIEAPAGFPAFIFQVSAQQSRVEDLKISQTSNLTTTGTATYAPGTNLLQLTGCTLLDIQNNQVIRHEGSGGSMVLVGRTAAMTSGSNAVTVTNAGSFGNYYYYPGQMVSIAGAGAAGAPLVGYVGTLGTTGSFSMVNAAGTALNASTTVSGSAITIFAPTIARVVSGGGTATLTLDTNSYNPIAQTASKISHHGATIYSLTQIHGRGLEIGADAQAGLVLSGRTTGGEVADTCSFYDCTFSGFFSGVVFQGNDAQVNSFFMCDFAGPQISILDNGLLGNYYYGCHWAFNCGFQFYNVYSQIHGGYVESNTGWAAAGGWFAYTMSLANGGGLKGFAPAGGFVSGPPLQLSGPFTARDSGVGDPAMQIYGQVILNDAPTGVPGVLSNYFGCNLGAGATGNYIRIFCNGGSGVYLSTATDMLLNAASGDVQFRRADTTVGSIKSTGMDIVSGKAFSVAGTQVLGARKTGWTVATGTATRTAFDTATVTLAQLAERVKALIDDLHATAGHGTIGT